MTENQIPLFTLPARGPKDGSPVFIADGGLFRDESTESIQARLMMKNLSGKELSSVRIRLVPLDTDGREIAFDTGHDCEGPFSGEGPHALPDIMLPFMTASFRADVIQAAFADESIWEDTVGSVPAPLSEKHAEDEPPAPAAGSSAEEESSDSSSRSASPSLEENAADAPETISEPAVPAKAPAPSGLAPSEHPKDAQSSVPAKAAAPAVAEKTGISEAEEEDGSDRGFSFRKLLVILIPALLILGGLAIVFTSVYLPERRYKEAVELFNSGRLEEAIPALEAMNGYKDSALYISTAENAIAYQKAVESYEKGDYGAAYDAFSDLSGFGDSAEWAARSDDEISAIAYSEADALLRRGKLFEAASAFYAIKDYSDSWDRCFAVWGLIAGRRSISAGSHTVCLADGGKILAAGDNRDGELDLSQWNNIAELSAGNGFTVGLKYDGTVVAAGNNDYGQCDVSGWTDIVYVSAGYWSTAGIRADGTIVIAGRECDVSGWSGIRAMSLSIFHTVGLLSDGTVVAAEIRDNTGAAHDYGQEEIDGWTDIVSIAAGYGFTVGLRKDGTVVAAGDNTYGQCDVEDWEDIVAVSANFKHVIGLKADGTVVAAGWNENGECDVEDWEDIVAISTGTSHTIGLRSDGTLLAVGNSKDGRCDVEDWKNILVR